MREQGEKHVFKYKPWYKGLQVKLKKMDLEGILVTVL